MHAFFDNLGEGGHKEQQQIQRSVQAGSGRPNQRVRLWLLLCIMERVRIGCCATNRRDSEQFGLIHASADLQAGISHLPSSE